MNPENETPVQHVINAARYSMAGFRAAWKHELAFRIEATVIAVMLPVGLWLAESAVEYALLIGSCMIVLITELLNSAMEAVVDRIGQEHHILSKTAKDLGSAAACLSQLTAALVWALIACGRFFG